MTAPTDRQGAEQGSESERIAQRVAYIREMPTPEAVFLRLRSWFDRAWPEYRKLFDDAAEFVDLEFKRLVERGLAVSMTPPEPGEAPRVTDRHRERAREILSSRDFRQWLEGYGPAMVGEDLIAAALADTGSLAETAASVWEAVVSLLDSGTPPDGLRVIAAGNAQSLRQRAAAARSAPSVAARPAAGEGERDGLA